REKRTFDNPDEEWLPIRDYVGYEVSNFGRVRSFWGAGGEGKGRRGLTDKPKLIGGYIQASGHHQVAIYMPGALKPDRFGVHVLVLEAFVGPRPEGHECCHNDGDPGNNHVDNLRWDTPGNNQRDTLSHGTHRHAKLN